MNYFKVEFLKTDLDDEICFKGIYCKRGIDVYFTFQDEKTKNIAIDLINAKLKEGKFHLEFSGIESNIDEYNELIFIPYMHGYMQDEIRDLKQLLKEVKEEIKAKYSNDIKNYNSILDDDIKNIYSEIKSNCSNTVVEKFNNEVMYLFLDNKGNLDLNTTLDTKELLYENIVNWLSDNRLYNFIFK